MAADPRTESPPAIGSLRLTLGTGFEAGFSSADGPSKPVGPAASLGLVSFSACPTSHLTVDLDGINLPSLLEERNEDFVESIFTILRIPRYHLTAPWLPLQLERLDGQSLTVSILDAQAPVRSDRA